MIIETAITGLGICFSLLAIHQVRRASRDAVHGVEPDPNRVRRFVETAPLEFLETSGPEEGPASRRQELN